MWFCPLDGTLLQVRSQGSAASSVVGGQQELYCSTCPYSCPIDRPKVSTTSFPTRKRVDDILGGSEAWKHVDRTAANCPKCDHREAYFLQMQIRSADEPMSIFYKCVQCSHQWNDK